MITYIRGNLFLSPAKVLVNAVNTEGVMGRGIAKEFKKLFPKMFDEYQKICEKKLFKTGMLWIYKTPNKWVLNFPTKENWRRPAQVSYIESGLKKFVDQYAQKGISSIAFPTLGCGNGELDWETQVRPLMEKYLKDLPIDIYIHLYSPEQKNELPEHKQIRDISRWLQDEPQFLSFSEVYQTLKNEITFSNNKIHNIHISFPSDEENIEIISNGKTILWHRTDLIDFWSILRNHGFVTYDNIPVNLRDSFEEIIEVFSILSYITPAQATVNYTNVGKREKILALQLLPNRQSLSQNEVSVAV